MKAVRRLFPAIALLLCLAACSTALKRASQSMEAGNYDEALRIYEQILQENPNDTDAVTGLRTAQQGYLSQKLIQVRMARLASNWDESLSLLRDVLTREGTWKTAPSGNVSFTQEEETGYAIGYARDLVHKALAAKHPLQGEIFMLVNAVIFDSRTDDSLRLSRQEIQAEGQALCRRLRPQRDAQSPYLVRLISQICLHYAVSEDQPRLLEQSRRAILAVSFGDAQVSLAPNSFPLTIQAMLTDIFRKALKNTAWFEADAPAPLAFQFSGQFVNSHTKTPVTLVKQYEQSENYTEYVSVAHTKQVPYTTSDPIAGTPVTRYQTETYSVNEPQSRTRYVPREYSYSAVKHEQNLSIAALATTTLQGATLQIAVNEKSHADGIEHDENQPLMGLQPSRPNLPDPDAWERLQLEKLGPQFQSRAADLWRDHACQDVSTADRSIRCVKQAGLPVPANAELWFQTQLGISVAQAHALAIL